jgi:hypothetical protein
MNNSIFSGSYPAKFPPDSCFDLADEMFCHPLYLRVFFTLQSKTSRRGFNKAINTPKTPPVERGREG